MSKLTEIEILCPRISFHAISMQDKIPVTFTVNSDVISVQYKDLNGFIIDKDIAIAILKKIAGGHYDLNKAISNERFGNRFIK